MVSNENKFLEDVLVQSDTELCHIFVAQLNLLTNVLALLTHQDIPDKVALINKTQTDYLE